MSRLDARYAVDEPQHGLDNLKAIVYRCEGGAEYVDCKRCGRQWIVHGPLAEVITRGDYYCDDHPAGEQ